MRDSYVREIEAILKSYNESSINSDEALEAILQASALEFSKRVYGDSGLYGAVTTARYIIYHIFGKCHEDPIEVDISIRLFSSSCDEILETITMEDHRTSPKRIVDGDEKC